MLHVRGEGGLLRNGLNFYPFSEWGASRGFIFKWNGYAKWFRYGVKARKWYFDSVHVSDYPDDIETEHTTVIDLPRKR